MLNQSNGSVQLNSEFNKLLAVTEGAGFKDLNAEK